MNLFICNSPYSKSQQIILEDLTKCCFFDDLPVAVKINQHTNYRNCLCLTGERFGKRFFVTILVNEENESIMIRNMLFPDFMRGKGLSKKIIYSICLSSSRLAFSFFIDTIANKEWYNGLVRHGAIIRNDECLEIPISFC